MSECAPGQEAQVQHLTMLLAAAKERIAAQQLKLEEYAQVLQSTHEAYDEDRSQLVAELERYKTEFHRVLHSASWRLTGPFRRVVRLSRRVAVGLRPSTPNFTGGDKKGVPEHAEWVVRALKTEPPARPTFRRLIASKVFSGR